ncbi:MAG: hypothetical protein WAX82_00430, partial [Gemmiger qucibialis]
RCSPLRSIFVSLTFLIGVVLLRQYRIILSADTVSEVRQLPERCLSRKAGIVRCCHKQHNTYRKRQGNKDAP